MRSSCEDSSLHSKLKDFVALLEHLVLQRPVIHGQLSVLKDEPLHGVAVVGVDREDFGEADEHFVLDSELRVDKGSKLLREVYCLVDSHLSSLLLVFLEEEGQGIDHL